MNNYPVINTGPVTDMASAKVEYAHLQALLNQTSDFPMNGSGWSNEVLGKIETRLTQIRFYVTKEVFEAESEVQDDGAS